MKAFAVAARILTIAVLLVLIVPLCLAGTVLVAVIAGGIAGLIGLVCTVLAILIIMAGLRIDNIKDFFLAKITEESKS